LNCGFRDDFSSHLDIYIGLPSTGVRSSFNASITQSYNKIYESDAKHAALRRKSKDWLAQNQDNVSDWGDMSIHGLLLQ
jgi:hypothetical protein